MLHSSRPNLSTTLQTTPRPRSNKKWTFLLDLSRLRQTDLTIIIPHRNTIGGDLAPSLGDGKKFRGPKFPNWPFLGKNFHFHAENFWWLFLVIDHIFLFLCFACLIYLYFWKNPWWHHVLLSSYFRTHPITLLLKILGERIRGPSSTSIF